MFSSNHNKTNNLYYAKLCLETKISQFLPAGGLNYKTFCGHNLQIFAIS
jgi:hypothetical protein